MTLHVDSVDSSKGPDSSIVTQMTTRHISGEKREGLKEQNIALSNSHGLTKSEPKKKRGWKGWVEIDEDETPQDCSDIGTGSEARYTLRTRPARIGDYSIDDAITIEDSDSDDVDDGVEDTLPRTSCPIPLPEPAAPWRSVATAGRADTLPQDSRLPIPLPPPTSPWTPMTTAPRRRASTEGDQGETGNEGTDSSVPVGTSRMPETESESESESGGQEETNSQNTSAQPHVLLDMSLDHEVREASSEDESSEASEEQESVKK